MSLPITVTDGTAFAFPNVCLTPTPNGDVPIPYPSIADLSGADGASEDVTVGGKGVILSGESTVSSTSGDEAGSSGGVTSGSNSGACEFPQGSSSVEINGHPVVRMGDPTEQNDGNAMGTVLAGDASVLVGG